MRRQTVIQPKNFDGLHPGYKQVLVMNYRLVGYIVHYAVPAKLSITYPRAYFLDLAGPFIHALPFVTLLLVGLDFWFRQRLKWLLFGLAFYYMTIFPALVMGDKGTNFLPDRYMYIPCIGLLFIFICILFSLVLNRQPKLFKPVIGALIAVIAIYSYSTYSYSKVWNNTISLWTDAINKYPGMLEVAYKNRALEYRKTDRLDEAFKDYIVLERMEVKEAGIYGNIANIYGTRGMYDKSLEYYSKALEYDDNYFNAYLNRGVMYAQRGMLSQAMVDFEKAYKIDSTSRRLLESYAFANYELQNFNKSAEIYTELINLEIEVEENHFQRGLAHFNAGNYQSALDDFLKVSSISPSNGEAIYNCSVSYFNMNQPQKAMEYARKAQNLGFTVDPSYLQQIQAELRPG